jgi:diguanylate cyclase (GGDEF)-like protein
LSNGAVSYASGLRQQAVTRLLLVMVTACAVVVTLAYNTYNSIRERETSQKRAALEAFYAQQLPKVDLQWQTEAEQTKARIEFSRILEEPQAVRWAKLGAYLNAQWEFVQFSNLVILGPDGQPLFRYGTLASRLSQPTGLAGQAWYFDPAGRELYRVFAPRIWLGGEGQGRILLLKTVNHTALAAMSVPDTELVVLRHGAPVVDSRAPADSGEAIHALAGHIEAQVPWPHSQEAGIVIQAEQRLREFFPLREFLLRPVLVLAVFLVLLWLGLGRWLGRTVRRIESLKRATLAYGQRGLVAEAEQHMQAAQVSGDEVRDLSLSMQALMHQVEARDQEQRVYLETLAFLEEAVLELDGEGRICRASPGWQKLVRDEDSPGQPLAAFVHADDVAALDDQRRALMQAEKQQATLRVRLKTMVAEQSRWVECRLFSHRDPGDGITGLRGVLRDITQTYLQEKQITHMALHDALTHLPNRVLLEDRLKIALRLAGRNGSRVGVCFIDLDHFKNVNDALGHKAGDRLLVAFAERLRGHLRAGDTLARWGGDEFVLLLPDMPGEAEVREVAQKIGQSMQQPVDLGESEFVVTFSLGAAVFPDDARESEELLSEADRAMFFAKAQGRNQACFFKDISHKKSGREELYIQNQLANAINARQIQAWYQPIVSARDGGCVAFEVLARWHEPNLGWVSPATFIPMAENLGLIRELGDQILQSALAAGEAWRQRGHALRLAVNISKRQLFQPGFTDKLQADLRQHRLVPDDVILEVTESLALMDVENAAERLKELDEAGFRLAIDDFGTGFSSLSQLHEMPVDELKIDISFVRRLDDPRGLSMVQTILRLAEGLNLATIAEGVEDARTAERLRELGADYLQGYHFARPMPFADADAWLLAR